MIGRNVLIFLCLVGAFALPRENFAQSAAPMPYDPAQQVPKQILDEAAATSEAAGSLARAGNYHQAARRYEALLERWPDAMNVSMAYPAQMALAGAHLDAAVNHVQFADKARGSKANHTLTEQQLNVVNDHLDQVYTLVGTAVHRAGQNGISGPDREEFICQAQLRLAAAIALHGMVNSNADEIDKGVAAYERTEACNPDARSVARHLRDERRNVSGSIWGTDTIATMVSRLVKDIVPLGGGSILSGAVDVGYIFYKKSQPLVLPR
ncbi:MAG: hypothetical protein QOJ84_3075 [Bradyrhizobium sp.]|jgi:tetratricopeptide (TPR) repeat protein|nr:hypothetical protein [Bradyrhizobium sp.]